jgi:hypothetical protein
MTRNGLSAFARDAFGLSKKSFTSANVDWRNAAPPYSPLPALALFSRSGSGQCTSAARMRACSVCTSSSRAVANWPCGGERLSTRMRTRISPSSAKMREM